MTRLFEGAIEEKYYVLKSISLGMLFWIIQFFYQYFITSPGDVQSALIRGSAFTGASLIALALIVGPVAKLWPLKNYIRHRRTLGVLGFTFIIIHVAAVIVYLLKFDLSSAISNLNPYENALVFGLLAFAIYIPLYATSTDWSLEKIGFKKWKAVHRMVYFAWIFSVLHFLITNVSMLLTLPGYALLTLTIAVFILEIAAFIKHIKEKGGRGLYIGSFIIAVAVVLFYLAYIAKGSVIALYIMVSVAAGLCMLYVIYKITKKNENKNVFIL